MGEFDDFSIKNEEDGQTKDAGHNPGHCDGQTGVAHCAKIQRPDFFPKKQTNIKGDSSILWGVLPKKREQPNKSISFGNLNISYFHNFLKYRNIFVYSFI